MTNVYLICLNSCPADLHILISFHKLFGRNYLKLLEFSFVTSILRIFAAQKKLNMIGTIVNTAAIIAGSVLGAVLRRGISERYVHAPYNALGLCTVILGANTAIVHIRDSHFPVMFILAMAVGGILGTALRLDSRLTNATSHLSGGELAKGLTTGILLYCIGTLSMVGPMNSAIYGANTYLFTNATLDFVSSSILASTYGIGMVLAAPVLFCWQGAIYLLALYAKGAISPELITEISIVGGVLILSTGLNILNIKNCKTLNLIPALFMPAIFFLAIKFYHFLF